MDESFVFLLDIECGSLTKPQEFRIAQTTKRLILLHRYGGPIHMDGSYGALYMNFPFLLIGTSDYKRHFHPTTIAVTRGETKDDYLSVLNAMKRQFK